MGCILIAVGVAMLWGGGQGLHTWANHRQPLEISCGDFAATRPPAVWLRLTDCEIDVHRPASLSLFGGEVFLPVGTPGAGVGTPTHVMVVTRDAATMDLVGSAEALAGKAADAVANPVRDVQGLVRFGIELDDSDHSRLRHRDESLAADFVIVDEGEQPRLWFSLTFFCLGLLIAIRIPRRMVRLRRRNQRFHRLKASFEAGQMPPQEP